MSENKKPKLILDPEFIKNFSGSQEQLDELVDKIHSMFDSGALSSEDSTIVVSDASHIFDDLDEAEAEDLLKEASDLYGLDEYGYVKYPFTIH